MSGLLIDGRRVPIGGVPVLGPGDEPWVYADGGDGVPRRTRPQMVILHKTLADDPERVLPGHELLRHGQARHAWRTAGYWQRDPAHSGAHIVIDDLGVVCLADLESWCAWDANAANARSIGIEHCEEPGGVVREQTLRYGVATCLTIALELGIQLQVPRPGTYHEGQPLARFADGGSSLVGFFGHRDVIATRGRWDPGDQIFALLIDAGAEAYDFASGEDRDVWRMRQTDLNLRGHHLVVDGIPGPATTAALRAEGYRGGVWALRKAS